jgi:hypothetical protein
MADYPHFDHLIAAIGRRIGASHGELERKLLAQIAALEARINLLETKSSVEAKLDARTAQLTALEARTAAIDRLEAKLDAIAEPTPTARRMAIARLRQ